MIKGAYLKYKEIIIYLLFGVLTTLLNIVAYWFVYDVANVSNVWSTVIAQLIAIVFAYVTNKLWGGDSRNWRIKLLLLK